jgi:hypothetical protein
MTHHPRDVEDRLRVTELGIVLALLFVKNSGPAADGESAGAEESLAPTAAQGRDLSNQHPTEIERFDEREAR